MIAGAVIKLAVGAVAVGVLWNTTTFQNALSAVSPAITSITGNSDEAAAAKPAKKGKTHPIPFNPAAQCNVAIDLGTDLHSQKKDFKKAARLINSNSHMHIVVTTGGNAPKGYTVVPVEFITNAEITDLSEGRAVYALTDTYSINKAGTDYYSGSRVIVNTDTVETLSSAARVIIYAHELGHVAGVGHSDDDADMMSERPSDVAGISASDAAALGAATKPCA